MSPLTIGAIVFACVFAGALFGMFLGRVLPKEHLSAEAKDVIKVTMAMIATLAALVLGLLTASAKSSLDDKENQLRGRRRSSCSTARLPNTGRRRKRRALSSSGIWRRGSLRCGQGRGHARHPR
jgi:hypothetical protein